MRARKTLTIATLAAAGVAMTVAPAHGAGETIEINTAADCSKLDSLVSGTTVTINKVLCPGSYAIYSDVTDITIVGTGKGGFQRDEEDEESRSLRIDHHSTVSLKDLTFLGQAPDADRRGDVGTGRGGVEFDAQQRPPVIERSAARASGGFGTLTVTGSTFTDIESDDVGEGGAIAADLGEVGDDGAAGLSVSTTTFTSNAAYASGGAVAVNVPVDEVDGDSPAVSISDSHFVQNVAGPAKGRAAGGGLSAYGYLADGRQLLRGGAARATGSAPDVALTNNDFTGNRVEGPGGSGGGAELDGVTVTSTGDRFLMNRVGDARGEGGGISVRTHIQSPRSEAGGIYRPVQGTLTAVNDAVAGNVIGDDGEGAGIYGGSPGSCGGFASRDVDPSDCGTTIDLTHVTIAGNHGGAGSENAGVAMDAGDALDVDRSIVFGNTNDAPTPPADGGEQPPRAAALIDNQLDTDDPSYSVTRTDYCFPQVTAMREADANGNICADPKLADAAYDPERSPDELPDLHQTTASPTVDAVGPAPTEQRDAGRLTGTIVSADFDRPTGDPRSSGKAPDMGADEAVPQKVVTTDTTTTTTTTQQPGGTPSQPTVQVQGKTESSACGSKRFFRIVLRKKKGRVYRSAKISVNGKKVKVTKSKDKRPTTRIDLREFGFQTIRIKITAKLANGKTLKGKRTYHPCRPSLDDGVPPKL